MKLLERATNPFLLVVEGFVVGALAFLLVNPQLLGEPDPMSPQADAIVQTLTR
jgi:hypothetical protein